MILFKDDTNRLLEIRTYIDSHLRDELSLDHIARNFNLSVSTLRRHFLFRYRITIHSYILKQRMLLAQQLLQSKSSGIAELSEMVGYKDRCSFTRAFTKYYGQSPLEMLLKFQDFEVKTSF